MVRQSPFETLDAGAPVSSLAAAIAPATASSDAAEAAVRSAVGTAERIVVAPASAPRLWMGLLIAAALFLALLMLPRAHYATSFPLVDAHGQAEAVRFDAYLLLPAGAGPHPAVALLSGCTPLGISGQDLARDLRSQGYAVLLVSRLQQSPLAPACGKEAADAVAEARGAVAHLRRQAAIDPARVGIIGVGAAGVAALALADEPTSGMAPALSLSVPLLEPGNGDGGQNFFAVAGLDPGALVYRPYSDQLHKASGYIQRVLDARLKPAS